MPITHTISNATALSSTSTFSSLPYELRHQIYTLLLPQKQTLRVGIYQISTPSHNPSNNKITFAISPSPSQPSTLCMPSPSNTPIASPRASPLLSLTHETRTFFLTHFPLSLPCGKLGTGRVYFSGEETVFVDKILSWDGTEPLFDTLEREREILKGIKRLAIDRIIFGSNFGCTGVGAPFGMFLGLFGALEGLGFVVTNWGGMGEKEREEVRRCCEKEFVRIREGMLRCVGGHGKGGTLGVPEMRVIEGWP